MHCGAGTVIETNVVGSPCSKFEVTTTVPLLIDNNEQLHVIPCHLSVHGFGEATEKSQALPTTEIFRLVGLVSQFQENPLAAIYISCRAFNSVLEMSSNVRMAASVIAMTAKASSKTTLIVRNIKKFFLVGSIMNLSKSNSHGQYYACISKFVVSARKKVAAFISKEVHILVNRYS